MKYKLLLLLFFTSGIITFKLNAQNKNHELRTAPAPLFRDPVTDGAADPVIIYNEKEKTWWMLYTQRRANLELPDVAFCYGNAIGVAVTEDHGQNWIYKGTLNLEFEKGHNTFWAPDVIYHNGRYHLFVTYIQGVYSHWGGSSQLLYYTSDDLWSWKLEQPVDVGMKNVIDGCIIQKPDGSWRMFYRGDNNWTNASDSRDLKNWTLIKEPVIKGEKHEGPNVFKFKNYYWMVTDEWSGMRVYRSSNLQNWTKQGKILNEINSKRFDDHPTGAHGDVVVAGDKAYIFYFTHPGRKEHTIATMNENGIYPFNERRSSIQVAELVFNNGTLVAKRDEPFDFWMP